MPGASSNLLTADTIQQFGNAGAVGILALALLLVVTITVAAQYRQSRQQSSQSRQMADHHTAEMALWQRALDQFEAGQEHIADALRQQSAAITALTQSVGTDALNQIRLGAGTQIAEVNRKLERLGDALDRIESRLEINDDRIGKLEVDR